MLRRSFLEGVVDIHIHAGPSVANRKVDAYEMLRQAEEAGYADPWMPDVGRTLQWRLSSLQLHCNE